MKFWSILKYSNKEKKSLFILCLGLDQLQAYILRGSLIRDHILIEA